MDRLPWNLSGFGFFDLLVRWSSTASGSSRFQKAEQVVTCGIKKRFQMFSNQLQWVPIEHRRTWQITILYLFYLLPSWFYKPWPYPTQSEGGIRSWNVPAFSDCLSRQLFHPFNHISCSNFPVSFLKCGNRTVCIVQDVDSARFYILWFVLTIVSETTQNFPGIFGCCCILSRWVERLPGLFPELQLSLSSSALCKLGLDYSSYTGALPSLFTALAQLCIALLGLLTTCVYMPFDFLKEFSIICKLRHISVPLPAAGRWWRS